MLMNMGELINLPMTSAVTDGALEREQPATLYQLPRKQSLIHDDLSSYEQRTQDRLNAQVKALEVARADGHPVVTTSRDLLVSEKALRDLGATMVGALPAAHYLAEKFQQPLGDTLDELTEQFGYDGPPTSYQELKKYWTRTYVYGTGVFHMELLTDGIDSAAADHFSVRRDVDRAMTLLERHPIAFMNCLSAARACTIAGEPAEYYLSYLGVGKASDEPPVDRSREMLRILASHHVAERPFATWYLMNKTAEKDGDMSYVRPLLSTLADVEVGTLRTKYDNLMTPLLERIDDSVKYAVRSKWNRYGNAACTFYRHDFGGHIDGALRYDDTILAPSATKRNAEYSQKHIRDAQRLRANLSAMTTQLVKYGKVRSTQ